MPSFRVLLTDYAWPDVELERRRLAAIDAELIVADEASAASLAQLAAEGQVDAILTTWAQVPAAVICASPRLRVVSRLGIGLDNIDVPCCTARGIPVTNVPDYCQAEVAEHALALLLALARKVAWFHAQTKAGRYERQSGPQLRRIAGQTLGIVGLGSIGRTLAEKARALGLCVVATRRRPEPCPEVELLALDDLLARSDFVSLHLPLSEQTRHLIGPRELARMKPTACLINTARGGLVDHRALAEALAAGRLAGAALDVQDPEPPDLSLPPYNDPRVIVTPHAAFLSAESLVELRTRAVEQTIAALLGHRPAHVVNPAALGERDPA